MPCPDFFSGAGLLFVVASAVASHSSRSCSLLNNEHKVQVCDATADAINTTAGCIKKFLQ